MSHATVVNVRPASADDNRLFHKNPLAHKPDDDVDDGEGLAVVDVGHNESSFSPRESDSHPALIPSARAASPSSDSESNIQTPDAPAGSRHHRRRQTSKNNGSDHNGNNNSNNSNNNHNNNSNDKPRTADSDNSSSAVHPQSREGVAGASTTSMEERINPSSLGGGGIGGGTGDNNSRTELGSGGGGGGVGGFGDTMNLTLAQSARRTHASAAKSLYGAALSGKDEAVALLLRDPAIRQTIDQPYKDGTTALHAAANAGFDTIAELLINAGAKIDAAAQNGATPLCFACSKGHVKVVEALLNAGASQTVSVAGWRPLHLAVSKGHAEVVEKLLAQHGNNNDNNNVTAADLEFPASNGHTPIAIAIQNGRAKVLEVLLAGGADANALIKGWSPLHIAVLSGSTECVELLLEANADIDLKKEDGVTPIFLAAEKNLPKMITCLAQHEANLELKAKNHATPLWNATRRGNVGAVEALLKAGANTSASVSGWPILHIAAEQNEVEILHLLLHPEVSGGQEVDLSQINSEGNTALHVACEHGCFEAAKEIVDVVSAVGRRRRTKHGTAAPHRKEGDDDDDGDDGDDDRGGKQGQGDDDDEEAHEQAALAAATASGSSFSLDQPNRRKATPLCVAAHFGFIDIVELLIERGADIHYKVEGVWDAATLAADQGHGEVVDLLEKNGAVSMLSESEGMSPLNVGPRVAAFATTTASSGTDPADPQKQLQNSQRLPEQSSSSSTAPTPPDGTCCVIQ